MEKDYINGNGAGIDYDDSDFKYSKHGKRSGTDNPEQSWFLMSKRDWYLLSIIAFIGLIVRFFRISQPPSVVFDEVHFGGFAGKYIKREFFFDVHPPLAKMMIAGIAWFFNFDGEFDFKDVGKAFAGHNVPYIAMRLLQAFFGWLLIPTAYLSSKVMGFTSEIAGLSSILVLFDNALVTQSRYIFLDPPLILFTALASLFWCIFCNHGNKPFSFRWWSSLALTGVFLGLTLSCKWVGLFTIALIGFSTIKQLWDLVGDLSITPSLYFHHFMARALCLILIPLSIYITTFKIQFDVLNHYTDAAGSLSPEFQNTMIGSQLIQVKKDVIYGSKLRIKHIATSGGYLHSHSHNYPGGSNQQQVTLYPHRDSNNFWIITKAHGHDNDTSEADGLDYVKHNDVVRLLHESTQSRLHSHSVRPVFSSKDYINEVSGYPFGDTNDNFRVEILEGDSRDPESSKRLMALYSKFRLVHIGTGCVLYSRPKKLPKWGYEQQEVFCIKSGRMPRSKWIVEYNDAQGLESSSTIEYGKAGFFKKFFEMNHRMWTTNNDLTSSHPYDSRPHEWPFLRRGIGFWGNSNTQIYLLGNPLIWYISSISIFIFVAFKLISFIVTQRGILLIPQSSERRLTSTVGYLTFAWFLHIFPFFLMKRQLFLHHYLPALYFSILCFCGLLDLFIRRFRPQARLVIVSIFSLLIIYVFSKYYYLIYGLPWSKSACKAAKWGKHWDFDCNRPVSE